MVSANACARFLKKGLRAEELQCVGIHNANYFVLVTVKAIDVLEETASTVLNVVPIRGHSLHCAGILRGADGTTLWISKCY